MFEINVKTITFVIAGCPENGIAAVDYRRQHNIPAAPTCIIKPQFALRSEALASRYRNALNQDADLVLDSRSPSDGVGADSYRFWIPSYPRMEIPAAVAAAVMSTPTEENLSQFLDWLIPAATKYAAQREAEREAERAAKREAEQRKQREAEQRKQRERAALDAAWAVIEPFLTDEERFLRARDRLSCETVKARLRREAVGALAANLQIDAPPTYTGPAYVSPGHYESWQRAHWEPEWVPTIRDIEAHTGHPVTGIATDCIYFNTAITVAWQQDPLAVNIKFFSEEESAED